METGNSKQGSSENGNLWMEIERVISLLVLIKNVLICLNINLAKKTEASRAGEDTIGQGRVK